MQKLREAIRTKRHVNNLIVTSNLAAEYTGANSCASMKEILIGKGTRHEELLITSYQEIYHFTISKEDEEAWDRKLNGGSIRKISTPHPSLSVYFVASITPAVWIFRRKTD